MKRFVLFLFNGFFLVGALQASALSDLAAGMAPGTWAELPTIGLTEELLHTNSGKTSMGFAEDFYWDPGSRRAYFIGKEAHHGEYHFISFGEDDNAWRRELTPPWAISAGSGHAFDSGTINPATGEIFFRPYSSGAGVVHRRPAGGDWSALPQTPNAHCCDALEYFPDRNELVVVNGTGLSHYPFPSGPWLTTPVSLPTEYVAFAEYNPVHRQVLFGMDDALYTLSASGVVSGPLAPAPFNLGMPNSGVTVDPVSGQYLVFGWSANYGSIDKFYVYDQPSNFWENRSASLPSGVQNHMIACPIPSAGVVMFMTANHGYAEPRRVYLYKHAAGGGQPPAPAVPTRPRRLRVG